MNTFPAPWGRSLIVISAAATVLLVGIAISLWQNLDHREFTLIPVVILLATACFTVRGYTISSDTIAIHRLLWKTHLSLARLESAHYVPRAMRGSIRLFGNGGMYSFTGVFRNRALGRYRAYVTDRNRTVVLKFPTRTVVLSPADPEAFVQQVNARAGGVA